MVKPSGLLAWGMVLSLLAATSQVKAQASSSSPRPDVVAYRCELPIGDGARGQQAGVRYQAQACDGGKPMTDLDQRTDAQRKDTARAAERDAKLARQLHRERRRRERQTEGQLPAAMDGAKPKRQRVEGKGEVYPLKRQRHFTAKAPKVDAPKQGIQP